MTAVPSPTAIILPFSTLATEELLEVNVKFPASAGVNVAPVATESRTNRLTVVFSTVIFVGVLLMDMVPLLIIHCQGQ